MYRKAVFICIILAVVLIEKAYCIQKRCIKCRSRGELGTCRDPFPFNVTEPEAETGIHVVACSSGWCGKIIDGTTGSYKADDYGASTERSCLQVPPNDYEQRCAYTVSNYKKVYMCFCNGDLCNAASKPTSLIFGTVLGILITLHNFL